MSGAYNGVAVPADGKKIGYAGGKYDVPDNPIIPFIEGDGTGRDIWKASVRVFDAAVEKAYNGKRRVAWYEVFAGEKAKAKFDTWLPDDTVDAIRELRVAIKGPLTTPVGGGIRSPERRLAADSRSLGCVRPVKYYKGVPSPVKHPERMDVVIFRENTEDVYAGIEWEQGTPEAREADRVSEQRDAEGRQEAGARWIPALASSRFPSLAPSAWCAWRSSMRCENGTQERDPGAQGQHPEVYRGRVPRVGIRAGDRRSSATRSSPSARAGFSTTKTRIPNLTVEQNAEMVEPGMEFAPQDFRKAVYAEVKEVLDAIYATHGNGAWKKKLMINDRIADSIFQQIVTRPDEYAVLATPNLNGDYISDACAAQVGGLGIAPGANIGDGYAIFEATHGTAPKYADKDVINPGSVILVGRDDVSISWAGTRRPT